MSSAEQETINGVVISFFSTASSVGKTLISINMAAELARQGARVVLVDYDLQFGDVCNYLQLEPEQTLMDAQRSLQLMGSSFDVRECLTPYSCRNVMFAVLAAPRKLEESYNIETSVAQKVIEHLQGLFDYVIVDTTSMFSELNLMLLDISTIVTYLGVVDFLPTIKNMKIGSDTLRTLGYADKKIRLVLNRSNAKTRIGIEDVQKLLKQEFYYVIPNDFQAASQSIIDGKPLVLEHQDIALSDAIRGLVGLYSNRSLGGVEEPVRGEHKSSLFGRLFG
ncbi:MAG: AAA family ATPase [Selenomonadaceae bacterium]|jgi:pilus assembly protein CpaE|uniref:AAA family ATPase n=1 Tax=Selenomonas bovis TaxID=416586 RepID=UPI002AA0309B|nr:AAA family ATPase [Selenomonadaceae bacterium]